MFPVWHNNDEDYAEFLVASLAASELAVLND